MDAGRELDALVATHIFGYRVATKASLGYVRTDDYLCQTDHDGKWGHLDEYSTDIAAAWLVVERFGLSVLSIREEGHVVGWFAGLYGDRTDSDYLDTEMGVIDGRFGGTFGGDLYASAPTAPLAICLAALRVVDTHAGASLNR